MELILANKVFCKSSKCERWKNLRDASEYLIKKNPRDVSYNIFSAACAGMRRSSITVGLKHFQ